MKLSFVLAKIEDTIEKKLKFIKKFPDGFRNDVFKVSDQSGKIFILIVYKREKGILEAIKRAHSVAEFLSGEFPVRVPLEFNHKDLIEISESKYAGLYNFLEGESIPWEAYKRRHLKSIGKTLSKMHFQLKNYSGLKLPAWSNDIKGEVREMKKYFTKVTPWIERKLKLRINLKNYSSLSERFNSFLNKKHKNFALHYDFVRGNILFSNKILKDDTYEITGIIDFEKVCSGPHITDIARTLSFLIVDCKFKIEDEIKKWFLERGYIKRGKNKVKIDDKDLEILLQIFWLRDFYKFLLHNPYESLSENEHYLRTRDKLIEREVLQHIN